MIKILKEEAFTIVELILVILVIWILSMWVSNINFNKISWKQKFEIFNNKIISNFETIRNNSLLWKWAWSNLLVPEKWKIDIWNWWIISYYYNWSTWKKNNTLSLNLEKNYELINTRCLDINNNETEDDNNVSTWSIVFKWIDISFNWWCTNSSSKIFQFTIKTLNDYEKNININIINWLIEEI